MIGRREELARAGLVKGAPSVQTGSFGGLVLARVKGNTPRRR
jgi:hypothetical protein